MNTKQLSKNVGQHFRVRPVAQRVDDKGRVISAWDTTWVLDAVLSKPAGIRLSSAETGEAIELESDNVKERRSPDFLLLRCQILAKPTGLDIEPIDKGSPIEPPTIVRKEEPPRPKYINVPPGYERRLNHIRYRILKDKASRKEDGSYSFPVRVKGPDSAVRAFTSELQAQFGVFPAVTRSSGGVTELEFVYAGPSGPEALEDLAIKHLLKVLQCGHPFTL